ATSPAVRCMTCCKALPNPKRLLTGKPSTRLDGPAPDGSTSPHFLHRRRILHDDRPTRRRAWFLRLHHQLLETLLGSGGDIRLGGDDLAGPVGIRHHQPANQGNEEPRLAHLIFENSLD